jgi:hypothetical protein
MRLLGSIVLSCLLPAAAFADSSVTSVDDEPMSRETARAPSPARSPERHAPADVGQLRAARVAAPDPVAVESGAVVAREHDVATPHTADAGAGAIDGDGDTSAELATRQMRRHQRPLDACVAAAHKRAPAAAGSLTLDFDVSERKVKHVAVSDDGVHDAQLAACLTNAARGFTFALAAARFRWPVAVHP